LSTFNLEALEASDINALIAGQRTRGLHPKTVEDFANSGDAYIVVTDIPAYQGKTAAQVKALRNQFTMIAKAKSLPLSFITPEEGVLLGINLPLHMERLADNAATEADAEVTA